jgi:hypothetical protein
VSVGKLIVSLGLSGQCPASTESPASQKYCSGVFDLVYGVEIDRLNSSNNAVGMRYN